jgi:hypothetical protein
MSKTSSEKKYFTKEINILIVVLLNSSTTADNNCSYGRRILITRCMLGMNELLGKNLLGKYLLYCCDACRDVNEMNSV